MINIPLFITNYGNFVIRTIGAALVFLIVTSRKNLYDKEKERSAVFRKITGALRAVTYTALVILCILPYSMRISKKWFYPVQRYIYTSGYNSKSLIHDLLPEELPEKTDGYKADFRASMGQVSGGVDITFVTDTDGIDQLCRRAEAEGAEHLILEEYVDLQEYKQEEDKSAQKIKTYAKIMIGKLADEGMTSENVEGYVFYDDRRWCYYLINKKTGYVRIYW